MRTVRRLCTEFMKLGKVGRPRNCPQLLKKRMQNMLGAEYTDVRFRAFLPTTNRTNAAFVFEHCKKGHKRAACTRTAVLPCVVKKPPYIPSSPPHPPAPFFRRRSSFLCGRTEYQNAALVPPAIMQAAFYSTGAVRVLRRHWTLLAPEPGIRCSDHSRTGAVKSNIHAECR